jgi:chemotaxis response regulator CheB
MLKPEAWPCPAEDASAICARIRVVAGVPRRRLTPKRVAAPVPAHRPRGVAVVGIVASTGGPAALGEILAGLPSDLELSLAIVQHLPPGFVDGLVRWLDERCLLPVSVARSGERLLPGRVWVAPDGRHLEIGETRLMVAEGRGPVSGHEPSGDVLLASLARHHGPGAAGIVLTGMGTDGATGLGELRAAGAPTVAQDRESCVVYGMPRAAAEAGAAGRVLPLDGIPRFICGLSEARTRPASVG